MYKQLKKRKSKKASLHGNEAAALLLLLNVRMLANLIGILVLTVCVHSMHEQYMYQ